MRRGSRLTFIHHHTLGLFLRTQLWSSVGQMEKYL